jgi:hypothetical protein
MCTYILVHLLMLFVQIDELIKNSDLNRIIIAVLSSLLLILDIYMIS